MKIRTLPRSRSACGLLAASLALAVVGASGTAHARGADTAAPVIARGPRAVAKMPKPLVVAHRGASGYRPEHTLAGYELAVAMGADYIEPDLVPTKDGALVDRHEPEISGTTDVAARPEFASRKTTKMLDGVATTGWFTEDFTLAELKTLRAKERLPLLRQHNTLYDGRFDVPTYTEVLRLRADLQRRYRRPIGVIPEIKHSTYFTKAGLPMEARVVAETARFGLNKPTARMWIQSFELTNLLDLRKKYGYKANLVFLTTAKDAPFDLVSRGDTRTYADLLAPASLRRLARSIDGIGPEKAQVIPLTSAGTLGRPTRLVGDAHRAGLLVMPWTFRNENAFLPKDYRTGSAHADHGRAVDEIVTYLRTGIDGFFTDQADTGVFARERFWASDDARR